MPHQDLLGRSLLAGKLNTFDFAFSDVKWTRIFFQCPIDVTEEYVV
jgi:hypothetical protein